MQCVVLVCCFMSSAWITPKGELLSLSKMSKSRIRIESWIGDYILIKGWNVFAHQCPNFTCGYDLHNHWQPVTESETILQNIPVENVNTIEGSPIVRSSIWYCQQRSNISVYLCWYQGTQWIPVKAGNLFQQCDWCDAFWVCTHLRYNATRQAVRFHRISRTRILKKNKDKK